MKQTQHGELHDYYVSIIGYEFECRRCKRSGELSWKRGKSLVPVTRYKWEECSL